MLIKNIPNLDNWNVITYNIMFDMYPGHLKINCDSYVFLKNDKIELSNEMSESLSEQIEKLKEQITKFQDTCSYKPDELVVKCQSILAPEFNKYSRLSKEATLLRFITEHEDIIPDHICFLPMKYGSSKYNLKSTLNLVRQVVLNENSMINTTVAAISMLFKQNNEFETEYFINVAFPAMFNGFISDEFTNCASEILVQLLSIQYDEKLMKLIGSFFMNCYYLLNSIQSSFLLLIANEIENDEKYYDGKLLSKAFTKSLSCLSKGQIYLMKKMIEFDRDKTQVLLIKYFVRPMLAVWESSPYFGIENSIMRIEGTKLFDSFLNNILPQEENESSIIFRNEFFQEIFDKLVKTEGREDRSINEVIFSGGIPYNLSLYDCALLIKLFTMQDMNIDEVLPPKVLEKFDYAFILINTSINALENKRPSLEDEVEYHGKYEEKWKNIHLYIVNNGISPLDEFTVERHKEEFVLYALRREFEEIRKAKKYKIIMRDRLSVWRPMRDDYESLNTLVQNIKYSYSKIITKFKSLMIFKDMKRQQDFIDNFLNEKWKNQFSFYCHIIVCQLANPSKVDSQKWMRDFNKSIKSENLVRKDIELNISTINKVMVELARYDYKAQIKISDGMTSIFNDVFKDLFDFIPFITTDFMNCLIFPSIDASLCPSLNSKQKEYKDLNNFIFCYEPMIEQCKHMINCIIQYTGLVDQRKYGDIIYTLVSLGEILEGMIQQFVANIPNFTEMTQFFISTFFDQKEYEIFFQILYSIKDFLNLNEEILFIPLQTRDSINKLFDFFFINKIV